MPREILLRDLSKCIDCWNCVTACGSQYDQARMTMYGPIFGKYQVPSVCLHCKNPVCVEVCPYGAMRLEDGQVFVTPNCRGCRRCMQVCPNTAIVMKQVKTKQKFFEAVLDRLVGQTLPKAPTTQITTDGGRCIQCGVCSTNCPVGVNVRTFAWQGLPVTDERCTQCGLCVDVCPRRTLSWEKDPNCKMQANKCDLCRRYDGQSACVNECPTGAMMRLTDTEAIQLIPELAKKLNIGGKAQKIPLYDAPPVRK